MQAPAAMSFDGYAVMSWQPLVVDEPLPPGLPPSGKSTGVADHGGVRRVLHAGP